MRSVICLLTAAIVMGACGGREVVVKQPGGEWTPTAMTPAEELEMRTNALQTGVQYVGGCTGGDDNAYTNEVVLYDGPANNTSPCFYAGGGNSNTWSFSFDHPTWRYFGSSEQGLNNNVQRGKARAGVGAAANRVVVHLTTSFGGGAVVENNNVAPDSTLTWTDLGQIGSSFIMCKLSGGNCL